MYSHDSQGTKAVSPCPPSEQLEQPEQRGINLHSKSTLEESSMAYSRMTAGKKKGSGGDWTSSDRETVRRIAIDQECLLSGCSLVILVSMGDKVCCHTFRLTVYSVYCTPYSVQSTDRVSVVGCAR